MFKKIISFFNTIWFYIAAFSYIGIYGSNVLRKYKKLKKIDEKKAKDYFCGVIRKFGKRALSWFGCRVEIDGDLEKLKKLKTFIIVSNHQSWFDIPLILGYVYPTAFIAKKELINVPVLNKFIEGLGSVFIERGNPRQTAGIFRRMARNIQKGVKYTIFPEGTRSIDGHVREFQVNSLVIPYRYKIPVVPIAIYGTINIHKKGTWMINPAKVRIRVFNPINPEDFSSEGELRSYVNKIIKDQVEIYRKQFEEGE